MPSADVKLYDPEITISEPAELPPAGGQTVLLPVQELRGLQLTLPALEVKVTLSEDGGMPTAYAAMVVAIWPTVMEHPPAQPAPRVAAMREAPLTACARL